MDVLVMRARSEWRRRWPALLALTALIAVTVAVVLTAFAGARRTDGTPARFMREDRTPDVFVDMQQLQTTRGTDEVMRLPQVADASLIAVMLGALPYTGHNDYLPLLAPIDGKFGVTTNRGVLRAGRRADPAADDEVLLSEAHARILRVGVGDRVRLLTFTLEETQRCLFAETSATDCPTTPRLSVRVVGIVRSGNDINGRGTDLSFSYLSRGFFERHRDDLAWGPLVGITLRPGVSAQSYVAAAEAAVPRGVEPVFTPLNASAVTDAVGVLASGLLLFAVVAALAGALAVGQAVVRQVGAGSADRATLGAFGATGALRVVDGVGPVAPAAVLGIAAGVLTAYLASARMPIGLARRAEPRLGRNFDGLVLGGGALVTLVAVLLCAALAAYLVDRRRRDARDASRSAVTWLAGIPFSPRAAVGIRMAFSPGRGRHAVPVRSAIVAVAAACAGVIGVLGFGAALGHLVHTPALYGWGWDVAGIDDDNDNARTLEADPAVAAVALLVSRNPVLVGEHPALSLTVTPVKGVINPTIVAGRAPQAANEVALGATTMHAASARIGDRVTVRGVDGELSARVVGRAVFPTEDDGDPIADGVVLSPRALEIVGRDESATTNLVLRYRSGANRPAAAARFVALNGDGDNNALALPRPPAEVDKLQQVSSLPNVLAGFLAALGILAVGHALVVGVSRRAHDFAVLRALGFRRRDVRATVSWEASALAIVGAAIGLPLGVLLGRVAWDRVARNVGVLSVPRVPVLALVITIPVAVAVAVLLALLPARRAARLRPAAILRSE